MSYLLTQLINATSPNKQASAPVPTPVPTPTQPKIPAVKTAPTTKQPNFLDQIGGFVDNIVKTLGNQPVINNPTPFKLPFKSPTVGDTVGKVVPSLWQAPLKAAGDISKSLPNSPLDNPLVKAGMNTPIGKKISNIAFGDKTPSSLQSQAKKGVNLPIVGNIKGNAAYVPLLAGAALDLAPLSGAKKTVAEEAASIAKKSGIVGKAADEVKLLTAGNPEARISETLAANKDYRAAQETIYKQQGGNKIARGVEAYYKAGGGEAGLIAQKKVMQGAYDVAQNKNGVLNKIFSEADISHLLDRVQNNSSLNDWQKLATNDALQKLINEGKILTRSSMDALNKVFDPQLVQELNNVGGKKSSKWLELGTLPRALKSALDYSAPLRQGLFFAVSHPKDFTRSFKNMFGYSFSEKRLLNFGENLMKRDTYVNGAMHTAGIDFTNMGGGLLNKEEAFMSNMAERIPGLGHLVKASDRAYTGFLNNFRADLFDTMYKGLSDAEKADSKILKDLGGLINAGTGRGSYSDALTLPGKIGIGKFSADLSPIGQSIGSTLNASAPLLNNAFFSPRLMASRLTLINPFYYKQLSGPARREALKGAIGTVAAGLTVLGLAKLNGADVVTDPTNADFGKIKFGDGTRYDPWGGFQQYATFISRIILQKSTSSTTGKVTTFGTGFSPSNTLSISKRFVRSKLAPVPATIVDLAAGTDYIGRKVTPGSVAKNFIEPFILNDLEDTIKTYGSFGPVVSFPGLFGVGTQTYNNLTTPPKTSSSGKQPSAKVKFSGISTKIHY